jgi:hypothetical protein
MVFDNYDSVETASETVFSGTSEHQISLSGKVKWKPLDYLRLDGGLALTLLLNKGHKSGSRSFGAEFSLGLGVEI